MPVHTVPFHTTDEDCFKQIGISGNFLSNKTFELNLF